MEAIETPLSRYSIMKSRRHELNDMIRNYENDASRNSGFLLPKNEDQANSSLNAKESTNFQRNLIHLSGKYNYFSNTWRLLLYY